MQSPTRSHAIATTPRRRAARLSLSTLGVGLAADSGQRIESSAMAAPAALGGGLVATTAASFASPLRAPIAAIVSSPQFLSPRRPRPPLPLHRPSETQRLSLSDPVASAPPPESGTAASASAAASLSPHAESPAPFRLLPPDAARDWNEARFRLALLLAGRCVRGAADAMMGAHSSSSSSPASASSSSGSSAIASANFHSLLFGCSLRARRRRGHNAQSARRARDNGEATDDGADAWVLLSADFTRDFIAQCQANSLVRFTSVISVVISISYAVLTLYFISSPVVSY